MENLITDLHIKNFKSIKDLEITTKRINLFIGKPNVGKSNILEALSLFCAANGRGSHNLTDFIRFDIPNHLFYDHDREKLIEVITNIGSAFLWYFSNNERYRLLLTPGINGKEAIETDQIMDHVDSNTLSLKQRAEAQSKIQIFASQLGEKGMLSPEYSTQTIPNPIIKKFTFNSSRSFGKDSYNGHLLPAFGNNLFSVLQQNKSLLDEVAPLFQQYGLSLGYQAEDKTYAIVKFVNGVLHFYPFSQIADTLQRIIFYYTAIESNKNSVLLFEEPETNSYPPYIQALAEKIMDSKSNQFFLTTHNPYLLSKIVENTPFDELALFVTSYKDYQTTARALNQDEIQELLEYGFDIFLNLDKYISEA
ncbi:MAG: AAA family ATPase [Bacteroidota bacterium]